MPPRYPASPLRCPECDSAEILRSSEHVGQQTYLCLDCDDVFTISAAAKPPKRGHTTASHVSTSAGDITAARRKMSPSSADEIRLRSSRARKQITPKRKPGSKE